MLVTSTNTSHSPSRSGSGSGSGSNSGSSSSCEEKLPSYPPSVSRQMIDSLEGSCSSQLPLYALLKFTFYSVPSTFIALSQDVAQQHEDRHI